MKYSDNPEQDAQDHINRPELEIELHECELCGSEAENLDGNNRCDGCKDLDVCSCGAVRKYCDYHSIPKWLRWRYNFRSNFIFRVDKLRFKIAEWLWHKLKL